MSEKTITLNDPLANDAGMDVAVEPKEVKTKDTSLKHNAISLVRLGANDYRIVTIPFNLETNEVGEPVVISKQDNKMSGEEKFKIEVVNQNIFK